MRREKAGLLLFLTLIGAYLTTFGGHFYSGDGIEMARTADSLVRRGSLALQRAEGERDWGYEGRGGERYAPYPLGQSLVEAPFIAAGRAATGLLPLEAALKERLVHAATVACNIFITAAIGWVLYRLARRIGYPVRISGIAGLLFGLCTMALVYARQDFADPLAALTLLAACLLLRRWGDGGGRAALAGAGALLGYSLFTKYQMVIYAPVGWIYMLALRSERPAEQRGGLKGLIRDTLVLAAPVVAFGLADLGVNYWKFGQAAATGYEQEASPWAGLAHIPAGLYGLLFSPGKSLFLYNPLLLLWPFSIVPFHRAHRSESFLVLSATAATLLFFSPLYWWHGDWAWGPRYLFPLLPLFVLSLAPLIASACLLPHRIGLRRLVTTLAILAVLVNFLGMTVNFFFYLRALSSNEHVHDDWNYIPGLSPLAFHAHVLVSNANELIGGDPIDYVYRAWSDGRFVETRIAMESYSGGGKVPDYFFFKPYDTALERYGLGAAGLLALGFAVAAAVRLRRELRA